MVGRPWRHVLITAGLGDFVALESRWDEAFAASLHTIHWASRAHRPLRPILEQLPEYAHVRHEVVHDHWHHDGGPVICAIDHNHLRGILQRLGKPDWPLPPGCEDWSIAWRFRRGLPYFGSAFLAHALADVSRFGLPPAYAVVQADTPWNRPQHRAERRYTATDAAATVRILGRWRLPGVVLGGEPGQRVPGLEGLIHLEDTTPAEAIEVLKGASAYCGIDSWLSVLAVQLFPVARLRILSRNYHLWRHRADYYAPHTSWPFVVRRLDA